VTRCPRFAFAKAARDADGFVDDERATMPDGDLAMRGARLETSSTAFDPSTGNDRKHATVTGTRSAAALLSSLACHKLNFFFQ